MDFTREPIVETIITAREGFKLVLKASSGDDEYSLEALEIVSFGSALFFRSKERPKSFLLPISDYKVLEVREPSVALKHPSGARAAAITAEAKEEKLERKRPRRGRRRRDESIEKKAETEQETTVKAQEETPAKEESEGKTKEVKEPKIHSTILPPPSSLIGHTLERKVPEELPKENVPQPSEPEVIEESQAKVSEEAPSSGFSASRFLKKLTKSSDEES